ncbi:DUF6765 family protein [Magnetovibrio sp. PR-2]|uniref:DUF6765 family protein n=1 Tax=Magnetovibrio sp. PR-2 TaxID=3120356 RepID=UPI002FCE2B11
MQIDFHHGVTYVVARLSGFSHQAANTIAYSAQYVDDATNAGVLEFQDRIFYSRISTANKTLTLKHLNDFGNHLVWIPFHFLPGNGGLPAGSNPNGSFVHKIICRPNSHVAQDMVRACIQDKHKPYALHRLGITAHVYVDTWAHQGFAGIVHDVNKVDELKGEDEMIFDANEALLSLGHGQALSNPDIPFNAWSYKNGLDDIIERDNLGDFTEAADELCKVFRGYLNDGYDPDRAGLKPKHKEQIYDMLGAIRSDNAEERHQEWIDAVKKDHFGFGAEDLDYIPKGVDSWKHIATGITGSHDSGKERPVFQPDFLTSDWKMFHDAAKEHRLTVIDDILPKYGICAG